MPRINLALLPTGPSDTHLDRATWLSPTVTCIKIGFTEGDQFSVAPGPLLEILESEIA